MIVGRNNGSGGGTSGQLVKIRLKDGKRTETQYRRLVLAHLDAVAS